MRSVDVLTAPRTQLSSTRVRLRDGLAATLHVAGYDRREIRPRVIALETPTPLIRWCAESGVRDALVGGFFVRSAQVPLGDVRIAGSARRSVPFTSPWDGVRACVHITDGRLRIAPRDRLGAEPSGDLLQAGPLLVAGGDCVWSDGDDCEGFSAGAEQFDSDITAGRYPRTALALAGDRVLAVACDGRSPQDAGMTLAELAAALLELGATDAINLDGGGSASLIQDGRLRNRPREVEGADLAEGRPIMTAIAFDPR